MKCLDQQAARARFMDETAHGLLSLGLAPIPALETLAGTLRPLAGSRRRHPGEMGVAVAAHRAGLYHDLVRGVEPASGSFKPEVLDQARRMLRGCAEVSGWQDHRAFLFTVALSVVPHLIPRS